MSSPSASLPKSVSTEPFLGSPRFGSPCSRICAAIRSHVSFSESSLLICWPQYSAIMRKSLAARQRIDTAAFSGRAEKTTQPGHFDYSTASSPCSPPQGRNTRDRNKLRSHTVGSSLLHEPGVSGPTLTGIFQGSTQCFAASTPITGPVHPQWQ